MRDSKRSFDEQVARLALSRLTGEAEQVAAMRGLPAGIRYATPEQELRLYYKWDDNVDPSAVLQERFQHHTANGMPPDGALAEALLESAASGFSNKLKMGQNAAPTSLSDQVAYHNRMAEKYPEYLALLAQDAQGTAGEMPSTPDASEIGGD